MTMKDVILRKVLALIGDKYNSYTDSVLKEIYNEIDKLQTSEFTYNKAMWIVDSKTPTKMGGEFIDVSKAVSNLKQQLREVKKNYNE